MEVKRSAHRPGSDQCSLLPQRRSDVGLDDSFDPGGQLQLGRRLHLRLYAAQGADHFDEPVAARALVQGRACHAARSHLVPADLHAGIFANARAVRTR
jgi:hypothetical protein